MFYVIKKDGDEVERFNHETKEEGKDGKPVHLTQADTDAQAVARAKELKADEVVTSDGRKVL